MGIPKRCTTADCAGAVTDADMDALRACLSLTKAGAENVRAAWAAIEKLERSSARTNPPAAHPTSTRDAA